MPFLKKLVFLSFISLFSISFAIEKGPLIFHYQAVDAPVLIPIFKFDNKSESIVESIPPSLLDALLKELNIKADEKSKKEELLKAIRNKDIQLKFYTVAWQKSPLDPVWPDKTYNYAFHETVANWLSLTPTLLPAGQTLRNFSLPISMGLFAPNNVESTTEAAALAIPFNNFSPQPVILHPSPKPGVDAYSPNNARFQLKGDRKIASFWTAAISPDKKNAVIIFNLLVDDNDIAKILEKAYANHQIEDALQMQKIILESLGRIEDASALGDMLSFLRKEEPVSHISKLFNDAFVKRVTTKFHRFPLNLESPNLPKNIFQFIVLSQHRACDLSGEAQIKNTCGRDSFKNAIFGLLLIDAYLKGDIDLFEKYAKDLTSKTGTIFIKKDSELTPDAQCIFKSLNDLLTRFRRTTGVSPEESTVDVDEANFIKFHVPWINRTCNIPVIPSTEFSVIQSTTLLNGGNPQFTGHNADLLIIGQLIDILKQNLIRATPKYKHAFILGTGVAGAEGKHWITANALENKLIVMDSTNASRAEYSVILDLVKLLHLSDAQMKVTANGAVNQFNLLFKKFIEDLQKIASTDLRSVIIDLVEFAILAEQIKELTDFYPLETHFDNGQIKAEILKILNAPPLKELALAKIFDGYFKDNNTAALLDAINQFLFSKFGPVTPSDVQHSTKLRPELQALVDELAKPTYKEIVEIISGGVAGKPTYTKSVDDVIKDVNTFIRTDVHNTLLMIAAANGYIDLVKLLLAAGAKTDIKDKNGKTAKDFAEAKGYKDIVELLERSKGGGMPPPPPPGPTPPGSEKAALEAIKKELSKVNPHYEIILKIISGKAGVDVYTNSIDDVLKDKASLNLPIRKDVDNTILMMAAARPTLDLVKLILAAGANPAVTDKNGKNALFFAEKNGHKDIAQVLKDDMAKAGI